MSYLILVQFAFFLRNIQYLSVEDHVIHTRRIEAVKELLYKYGLQDTNM